MKPEKLVIGVFLAIFVPAFLLDMFQYLVLWPTYAIDATFRPLGVLVFYTTTAIEAIGIFLLTWMMASAMTRPKTAVFMGILVGASVWGDLILNMGLISIIAGLPITELTMYAGFPIFAGALFLAYFVGWLNPWLWDVDYHQLTGKFKVVKRWQNPSGY